MSEIEAMRLGVFGDGAVMIASHVSPDDSRPPLSRRKRLGKRNGQWQMVISVRRINKAQ